jgi:hypothetical protein
MYYLFCQVYRGDRSCVYGDEEHAERVEGLLEEFDRTRERVLATAKRAVEEANRILALEHRDPTNALSARELEEANAKREFVKEDCETMPLPDLADRAKAALTAGDKARIFLYALRPRASPARERTPRARGEYRPERTCPYPGRPEGGAKTLRSEGSDRCLGERILHRGPGRAPGPLRVITFLLQIRRLFEWAIVDSNH